VNRYKSLRKAGKSKTAHQLVQEIVSAIDKLIQVGQDIAKDFPEIADEMLRACQDTKKAGKEHLMYFSNYGDPIYNLETDHHLSMINVVFIHINRSSRLSTSVS
jgi:hypothetical protein